MTQRIRARLLGDAHSEAAGETARGERQRALAQLQTARRTAALEQRAQGVQQRSWSGKSKGKSAGDGRERAGDVPLFFVGGDADGRSTAVVVRGEDVLHGVGGLPAVGAGAGGGGMAVAGRLPSRHDALFGVAAGGVAAIRERGGSWVLGRSRQRVVGAGVEQSYGTTQRRRPAS